ncbi:hypothetical protein A1O1_06601 [Capronia coronata CBS 617.96]|uniref:Deacetylase sirtuin-type domain-containing protein n=1 Tax=Capronia coronata CBS 617.96 TaxID=1182541 RepID=W9YAD8_9EURO|nr:uncharacterized protein A1O1_06601 [Capronia coronata CBS 617.96]EXJ86231.1 hypothetical protein A1O1_06601 [Capronia coronata CBS 617.96]
MDSHPSLSRPSPSKLPRMINQHGADRASSAPARRLSSPLKEGLQIRPRLNQYYTLDHAVALFKSAKNIVTLTGAGISTSLGVPDFRSKNGVYDLLKDSIYNDPQELFHIDNFKADPDEFYKQAAKVFPRMQGLVPAKGHVGSTKSADAPLVPLVPKYSPTHAFIAMLQSKGKLLTNYTQNIDGLEAAAGVTPDKLIQVHGTLATASCMTCGKRTTARKYMPVVRAGGIPFCKCSLVDEPGDTKRDESDKTTKKKRKRHEFEDSSDSEGEVGTEIFPKGLLKPDMTFFGEHISYSYGPRLEMDKGKVDLLVIIGTSLKVAPVNDLLLAIPPTVPQIWISKDRCQRQGVKVDIELLGECDLVLEEIARRAGWTAALERKLWDNQKSSCVKEPPQKVKKVAPRPEQDKISPVKPEEGLQIRCKTEAVGDKALDSDKIKSAPDGGEKSQLPAGLNEKPVDDKGKDSKLAPNGEGTGPLKHDINGTGAKMQTANATSNGAGSKLSKPKPNTNDANGKPTPLPPSKVTVELEEGTRSRWYIRRAK